MMKTRRCTAASLSEHFLYTAGCRDVPPEPELGDSEIALLDEWHAGTYGIPDEKTIDAIRLCARLEGVLTDPVYEGKSMAALIDLVRSGRIAPGSRLLYAHLGGQPALNAYAGVF
jgi:1-aminocyclopropane-1-carboxylate deaminase